MAKKVKVQMNRSGMRALLSGPEMRDAMLNEAEKRVPGGAGYEAIPGDTGGNRTRSFIAATDWESYNDNARNATLLRAISSEGGSDYVKYTTKSGKTRWATQAQVDNWTRGRR